MTLAELSVATAVTGILMIAVATLLIGTTRSLNFTNTTTDATRDTRAAMEAMTKTLRVAAPGPGGVAITSATDAGITFYASLNRGGVPTTTLVSYAWNGSSCVTRTQENVTNQCMLRTTVKPRFTYYAAAAVSGADTLLPTGALALADRQRIVSVGITLTASRPTSQGSPAIATVQDRVTLLNCGTATC